MTLDEHIKQLVREAVAEALGPSSRTLTRAEVAVRARTTERHVDDERRSGVLPATKRGRAYVFSSTDVDTWLATPKAATVTRLPDPIERSVVANGLVPRKAVGR